MRKLYKMAMDFDGSDESAQSIPARIQGLKDKGVSGAAATLFEEIYAIKVGCLLEFLTYVDKNRNKA